MEGRPLRHPVPGTGIPGRLSSQDARWLVGAQLDPIGGSKDPSVVAGTLPVAGQEPIPCFAGMAFARPVDELLFHQFIVSAHDSCWYDSVVVGCPSHDQWIELRDDPRLWISLQLL